MKEEWEAWLTKAGRHQSCVGGERRHGTQRIITSDDGHGCGNERGLTERNREVDAPVGGRDLVCE